jgi:NAD+ synthase
LKFSKSLININSEKVANEIIERIRHQVFTQLRRQGAIVGTSGGIDSSVVAALCSKALGPEKTIGILMPDKDNSAESKEVAIKLAETFGYRHELNDLTAALDGAGCYRIRNDGFRQVFPDWEDGWKAKIVLPTNILESNRLNIYRLAVESPSGEKMVKRLPLKAYLQIVAASNMKQRMRMLTVYYHAEHRNYAVVGTGNKNEYYQGFFVKYGDGGDDLKPIVHLYKTQVFQLAEYLGVPEEIRRRTPTTETYPASVSQEEFFFGLDFKTMDLLWFAKEGGFDPDDVAREMGLTREQVERVWNDIDQKQRTTEYLRMPPLGIDE